MSGAFGAEYIDIGINRSQPVYAHLHRLGKAAHLAGFPVPGVQVVFHGDFCVIGHAGKVNGIFQYGKASQIEQRFGDPADFHGLSIYKKQSGAAFVDKAAAVYPERNLVENLVIRVIRVGFRHLFPFFLRHFVVVGVGRVQTSNHSVMGIIQAFPASSGEGEGKGVHGLAAGYVQAVVAGKAVFGFRTLFFRLGAHSGEQKARCILPEEAAFRAQIGELAQASAVP